ncbi:selenocysteine-specific translation elongation factor [Tenuibacillus multivorans]|uniref:Selenocysteine-specific elongation factor n=1 Tax=Tenuibacillus multivorans TaxID=237069 RepID=A0A1H0CHH6_9BACI|nr:selenocysteine-specific translation elongation factor [Tenuibacillus multivorans]GEL76293.1 selenocysteine-specific translation elongation factor [Tenuibacillus multivorans]SDN57336.1 selenocysteine-specific elongation factor [Tenuibacillus multivorans]
MNQQNYTIGMAGHIDHGKTELVKALTGVETDRLKEEKDRRISIELGYAPLYKDDDISISIIDVPGHEKFIRQMIAGVSSIDLTILVIAADEGVMPQTREHLEILSFLNISRGIIVITKIDQVDSDLLAIVQEDIKEMVKGTVFEGQSLYEVDSISRKGIETLRIAILKQLENTDPKSKVGQLYLPVDQSFHIHGIGTVVRGTVVQGQVSGEDKVVVMPNGNRVKIKSIHRFNQPVSSSSAGQRTALALKGVSVNEVKRGSVLTTDELAQATNRIDIELQVSSNLHSEIKQRSPIKLHIGTTETYGRIIFYDRNKLDSQDTIYAQVELEESIYILKDQRYVLRRATPVETIGGGKVIEPFAQKHRHGEETVQQLKKKATIDQNDYILEIIHRNPGLDKYVVLKQGQLNDDLQALEEKGRIVNIENHLFVDSYVNQLVTYVEERLNKFHKQHPLLPGMNKSELIQQLPLHKPLNKTIVDYLVERELLKQKEHYVSLPTFYVQLNEELKPSVQQFLSRLNQDQLEVRPINEYIKEFITDKDVYVEDLKTYLIHQQDVVDLTDELYIEWLAFKSSINCLKEQTGEYFNLKEAKDYLGVSRKYLIPFLEKLDKLKMTIRVEGKRRWIK